MDRRDDLPHRVSVVPALDAAERSVLEGLAGVGDVVRRVWPGQPDRRSPWRPCPEGCCLQVDAVVARGDAAGWLRFLIRELLAPRSPGPVERAVRWGLPGGHRLDGRVVVDAAGLGARLVVVAANRVREIPLDDEWFPLSPPPRRGPGEVVPLETRRERDAVVRDRRSGRGQSTER